MGISPSPLFVYIKHNTMLKILQKLISQPIRQGVPVDTIQQEDDYAKHPDKYEVYIDKKCGCKKYRLKSKPQKGNSKK